jgi:uroporphyrin-3 C-methyltransferase
VLATLGWVVLLALILGFGAAAYYWQQNVYSNDLESLREQLAAIGSAQSSVSAQIEAAVAEVASSVQSAAAGVDTLGRKIEGHVAKQGELARSVSALYEKETQTSVDWVLAEAEYLILAATQRLALERDVDTAIAALRAADQRLRSAEHPDLIPIREKIIADVTALEAVNLPDVEGLAIYIGKTIDQVDTLPTKPIAEEVIPFATVRTGKYEAEDWRKLGYAIWSDLVDLVEVKDADLPDSVLFDPELRYFLRQNLKLELASARLAVLRGDSANLASSVGMIKRLLDAYYDVDHDAVANIIKRLEQAQAMELTPALPNITGSLDAIRKHRASRAPQAPAP